jgi:transcriptional regulator with XRE-family HTH domain
VDEQRLGRTLRALRRRRGWRQLDLAWAAGCSQNMVSRVERGHVEGVAVRRLQRLLAALDASLALEVRWRGPGLDRLLDEAHANLVAAVAARLRGLGWLVEIEVTYSEFGERGSYDVLAFHPVARMLLVVEVKTDLPSAEASLRKLDEKTRLAPKVARERFGWRGAAVGRLVVMLDTSTLRRRVGRHAGLLGRALPARSVSVKRWLAHPSGQMAGLWFLSARSAGVAISAPRTRERIRQPILAARKSGVRT